MSEHTDKAHRHIFKEDTREWAKQPGGEGYICAICGMRIPAALYLKTIAPYVKTSK